MTIEESYNSWAQFYDTNHNKTRDLDQRKTAELLDQFDFSKVIELGCGTGKNTEFLLQKAQKIIAIDFSHEMLGRARQKITDKRVTFQRTDLNMPWPVDEQYADLITVNLVLEHIQNLDFIFSQAYQKLKTDGLFYVSELHPFKQYQGSKARFDVDNETHELETFLHHTSEFLHTAKKHGFELIEFHESFDENDASQVPRLINLIWKKK